MIAKPLNIRTFIKKRQKELLQEKCLFKGFNTVTFEIEKGSGKKGAWFYCTSQLYFCAEAKEGKILSYVLIDLVKLKLLSNTQDLPWRYQTGKTRSNEGFKFMKFTDVPDECLIARTL